MSKDPFYSNTEFFNRKNDLGKKEATSLPEDAMEQSTITTVTDSLKAGTRKASDGIDSGVAAGSAAAEKTASTVAGTRTAIADKARAASEVITSPVREKLEPLQSSESTVAKLIRGDKIIVSEKDDALLQEVKDIASDAQSIRKAIYAFCPDLSALDDNGLFDAIGRIGKIFRLFANALGNGDFGVLKSLTDCFLRLHKKAQAAGLKYGVNLNKTLMNKLSLGNAPLAQAVVSALKANGEHVDRHKVISKLITNMEQTEQNKKALAEMVNGEPYAQREHYAATIEPDATVITVATDPDTNSDPTAISEGMIVQAQPWVKEGTTVTSVDGVVTLTLDNAVTVEEETLITLIVDGIGEVSFYLMPDSNTVTAIVPPGALADLDAIAAVMLTECQDYLVEGTTVTGSSGEVKITLSEPVNVDEATEVTCVVDTIGEIDNLGVNMNEIITSLAPGVLGDGGERIYMACRISAISANGNMLEDPLLYPEDETPSANKLKIATMVCKKLRAA